MSESDSFFKNQTPLMIAAQIGSSEMIWYLISRGHALIEPKCKGCQIDHFQESQRYQLYKSSMSPVYIQLVEENPINYSITMAHDATHLAIINPKFNQLISTLEHHLCGLTKLCESEDEMDMIFRQGIENYHCLIEYPVSDCCLFKSIIIFNCT